MKDIYTSEMREIEICDVDYMGDYRLCHLFNRLAEIATLNAEKLGLWQESMKERYGWVVAKQTLHLERPIHCHDRIELSTVIQNGTFVTFPRYYFIKKEEKSIGYCSSVWTLIDIEKRRIVAPKRVGIEVPMVEHDIQLKEPHQIDMSVEMKEVMQRKVLYSDVDINQHMNNTRYIQWAFDVIDYEIHQDYFVSDLTIHYKKEVRPLESVSLFLGKDEKRFVVEGRSQAGEVYFTLELIFQKR